MTEEQGARIRRVSPTSAEDLLMCRARALRRHGGGHYVETPAIGLGQASHSVAERVYEGGFDLEEPAGLRAAIACAFDAAVEARRAKIIELSGRDDVPPLRRWKNYRTIRSRLSRFLEGEVRHRLDGLAPVLLEIEEVLESSDGLIFGIPDRVEREGPITRVIDLKSGISQSDELSDHYKRQLMIYCYLWHETSGEWPEEAAVQRVDGRLQNIPVDQDEILGLIDGIHSRLQDVNNLLAAGGPADQLAEPTPAACAWCRRRPICEPFRSALDENFAMGGPSITGIVVNTVEAEMSIGVDVEIQTSNVPTKSTLIRVSGIHASSTPAVGQSAVILDALPTQQPDQLAVGPWTTVEFGSSTPECFPSSSSASDTELE